MNEWWIDESQATEVYVVSESEFDVVTLARVYHLSLLKEKNKHAAFINQSEAVRTFFVCFHS